MNLVFAGRFGWSCTSLLFKLSVHGVDNNLDDLEAGMCEQVHLYAPSFMRELRDSHMAPEGTLQRLLL